MATVWKPEIHPGRLHNRDSSQALRRGNLGPAQGVRELALLSPEPLIWITGIRWHFPQPGQATAAPAAAGAGAHKVLSLRSLQDKNPTAAASLPARKPGNAAAEQPLCCRQGLSQPLRDAEAGGPQRYRWARPVLPFPPGPARPASEAGRSAAAAARGASRPGSVAPPYPAPQAGPGPRSDGVCPSPLHPLRQPPPRAARQQVT